MSAFYEAIGRIVVTFVRVRYGKQLRVAALLGVAATVAVGYVLAAKDVEEG